MACHAQAVKAGKHYDPAKIYSGSAPVADLRMLEAIAVEKGFDVYETDVAMAFPHAQMHPRPDGKPTTMRQTEGTRFFYDRDQYIAEKFDADSVEQTTDGTHVTNGTMQFTDDATNMAEAAHVVTRAWYGHPTAGNAFIEQLHGAITTPRSTRRQGHVRLPSSAAAPNHASFTWRIQDFRWIITGFGPTLTMCDIMEPTRQCMNAS
jgi:hypothetical protein